MKIEVRVFRHDKAAPVHVEEVDSATFHVFEVSQKFDLGHPLRPTPDGGGLYENGEIQVIQLEK